MYRCHNMYRCQTGPLNIIFQIWAKNSTFPKIGILDPKMGRSRLDLGASASRPVRPHSLSGRSVAPLRSAPEPRPPTTSLTRDRLAPAPPSSPNPSPNPSVARADLAFAPKRPPPHSPLQRPPSPSRPIDRGSWFPSASPAPRARPAAAPSRLAPATSLPGS